MADCYLENEQLKIGVNLHGAELVSLVKKATGTEYMWCGDAAYWGRTSPVLFPFVGKLNKQTFTYKGVSYAGVPQHGYARDCDFVLAEQTGDTMWFELAADDFWKEKYPFVFLLRVGYRLEGNMVHVMWTVRNESEEEMSFSIGGHPAFNLLDGGLNDGFMVDLNTPLQTLVCGEIDGNGTLIPEQRSYELQEGKLTLSEELFAKDALIIDSDDIHTVAILRPDGTPYMQVRFDAPQLGIWSPVGKKAPFVCIEPWYGRCDRNDFTGDLTEREYNNVIAPGHSFDKEYVIDIL